MNMKSAATVFAFAVIIVNTSVVIGVPGTKSIKQCHKFYDLKFSLRNLDSFKPMTKNDLKWIQEQENNETIPTWVNNPFEDTMHEIVDGVYAAVGGVDVFGWEYPFMAALGFGDVDNIEYNCGGSLISDSYILTAAHCIFSAQREPVKYVRLGNVKIKPGTNESIEVQEFEVSAYYIHPNYSFSQRYNDIALIKLSKPATFTKFVRPICLEYERKFLRYKQLFAAGWGLLGDGEERSNHLQKVTLRQYTLKSCQKTYDNDRKLPNGIADNQQICAGTLIAANITDTCEGDSGGPLLYEAKRFELAVKYLTGIISFGVPCGIAPLPAVYTRVAYYIDWIEGVVWPN